MADLCVFRTDKKQIVDKDSLLYKCKWSPLEGLSLHSLISHTFVNGELAFHNGKFDEKSHAMRLEFDR
jgi:dihydroorotase